MKRAHFCTLLTAFSLGSLVASCQGRIPGNHKYMPTTNGSFADLAVSGPYAFATQSSLGLHIIDVSKPELAHEVGAFQSAADGRFRLVDHLAYLAGHSPCLQIVDVNDPAAPKLVGSFDGTTCFADDVVVDGQTAYLSLGLDSVIILDVSNPAAPVQLGTFATRTSFQSTHVAFAAGKLFIASDQGFLVVDVSNPAMPVALSSSLSVGTGVKALAVQGPRAYVAVDFDGLRIIDISTPASPRILTDYKAGSLARAVVVAPNGSVWYGDDGDAKKGGLHELDLADPSHPKDKTFVPITGIQSLAIAGPHAYVAGYSDLIILDL